MMEEQKTFSTRISLRWADIDANFHLRHSVFYDLCAQQRMEALTSMGITLRTMQEQHYGPIIFREECTFRREIKLDDDVSIDLRIRYLSKDHSRFSFAHVFTKADGTYCATLIVEGAWMDTRSRKLTAPPAVASEAMDHLPRTEDFAWK
jgi:acyl-CoA thioester hydrolase